MYAMNCSLRCIICQNIWSHAKVTDHQLIWFVLLAKSMSTIFVYKMSLHELSKNVVQVILKFCPVILHFGHNTLLLHSIILDTLGHFFVSSVFIPSMPNLHQILSICKHILQKPKGPYKTEFQISNRCHIYLMLQFNWQIIYTYRRQNVPIPEPSTYFFIFARLEERLNWWKK